MTAAAALAPALTPWALPERARLVLVGLVAANPWWRRAQ